MGLQATVDIFDLGLPDVLTADMDGETVEVEVDYGAALQAFGETFFQVATSLVPVDTGYLKSTISWESDFSTYCTAMATAEYAQYPEFGTWCQTAQPYFTPAIQEAMAVFIDLTQEAIDFADEMLQNILADIQAASMAAFGGEDSFLGFMAGSLAFIGITLLLFPILVNLYGIMKTFSDAFGLNNKYVLQSMADNGIEIEII